MSDLGIGWTDEPVARSAADVIAEAVCIAHDEVTEFARRVRFVAHNSAAVRRLCDEILLRRPGTDRPGDGIRSDGG